MEYYLIMCRSLTYAQRAMRTLERAGATVSLVRAPKSISQTGCGYGVRVSSRWLDYSIEVLRKQHIPFGKVYTYPETGQPEEVRV